MINFEELDQEQLDRLENQFHDLQKRAPPGDTVITGRSAQMTIRMPYSGPVGIGGLRFFSSKGSQSHEHHPTRDPDPLVDRSAAGLAVQLGVGILPQRRNWIDSLDCDHLGREWATLRQKKFHAA